MAPNGSGSGGNSYAQNGLIGHLANGTFGSFGSTDTWSGTGLVTTSTANLYGARYQYLGNSIIVGFRQDLSSIPTNDALIEFGYGSGVPSTNRFDQLKIRAFTNPSDPSSAFDFLQFSRKFKTIFAGQKTANAITAAKFGVYDGFNPLPASPVFSTTAVYGVSDGQDDAGSSLDYAGGVVGDVVNATATLGNYAVLGAAGTSTTDWAGYFIGRVFSTVSFTVSDRKLKTDVQAETGALAKLMRLRPSQYSFKSDSFKVMNLERVLEHGFIAQELAEVFPEMVTEVNAPTPVNPQTRKAVNPIAFKAVNYNQLHAIEVAAIQELKAEVESLKQQLAAGKTYVVENTALNADEKKVLANKAYSLSQNTPNPFSSVTTIRYTIPDGTSNAVIGVFDLNGKMLLQFGGLKGTNQITINGSTLQPGMYLYSLLQNGEEVITRKMVLTR